MRRFTNFLHSSCVHVRGVGGEEPEGRYRGRAGGGREADQPSGEVFEEHRFEGPLVYSTVSKFGRIRFVMLSAYGVMGNKWSYGAIGICVLKYA